MIRQDADGMAVVKLVTFAAVGCNFSGSNGGGAINFAVFSS